DGLRVRDRDRGARAGAAASRQRPPRLLRRVQGEEAPPVRRTLSGMGAPHAMPAASSGYAARYGLSPDEEAWRKKAEAFARDELAHPFRSESFELGGLLRL